MTAAPIVSVLTTCYNREALIGQAIESVLRSTFSDFEYIIVDDASTDRSAEIARSYAKSDRRIKVYVNDRNLGDYPNRNRAASLARGFYLKFIDSDDIIYPHGLEVMLRCISVFPEAAFGLSREDDPYRPFPICLDPCEAYRAHFFGTGLFTNAPSSSVIRRDRFAELGGFSGQRHVGDLELWLALARRHPVALMPRGLTWWRKHSAQENAIRRHSMSDIIVRYELLRRAIAHPECPLTPSEVHAALRVIRTKHVNELIGLARRKQFWQAMKIARSSRVGFDDVWRALASRFKTS